MLPVLVKLIGVLAHCGAFDVNVAVGVWYMLMLLLVVAEHRLEVSLIVSVTDIVPAVE